MAKRMIPLALVALIGVVPAAAQSFGRNKVRYDNFDFHILETPHFEIYYYPAEHDASVEAGRLAERWYARLSRVLDHTFTRRQPIVLYASHAQFTQTNVVPGFLGDGIGGVTEHDQGRVVLPFAAGLGETDHVLGHELVHAFQRDILRKNGGSIATLPLWFVEGMAEYLSIGRIDTNTAMWLRDAAQENHLPRIDQLVDPRWFPYRYGQALWAFLADRFGDDVVVKCLKSKASGGAIGRLAAVTGVGGGALSKEWHVWIRQTTGAAGGDRAAADSSKAIVTASNGGRLNIAPSLSPDGTSLAFLSERDRFSIDVFLADAATGRVERKIVQTASDPHFESLQFIESAGAWDPTGQRFVLAARSGGQAVLSILDMRSGTIEREMSIHDVDQAFSPSWSPDGRRIAFSALKGGVTDLYVVDLESGAVRALTSDAFADLQPAWSPDGRTIAFSTDRFSSSLQALAFGNFRLGMIDVDSRAIRELPGLPDSKHIDPQWSKDGTTLYFVADAGGRSNVYRLTIASGQIFQMTNVATGVSGITALSPAISVAQAANRLAFSVYRGGVYEIDAIDAAGGTPLPSAATISTTATALLPAAVTSTDDRSHAAAPAMPTVGLLDGKTFTERPYRPGLSLNRIVQPYLSAGGGSTGGFLRAGATLSFGDMLGDHQLETALQVGKSLDDFVAQAAYLNRRARWNWGVAGGQVPWLIAGSSSLEPPSPQDSTISRESEVFRQLHRQVTGIAVYPFSMSKRLELSGGVQSIAFDRQTTAALYSRTSGQLLHSTTVTTSAAPTVSLFETSAALVYDTALFGVTSPVIGQRYRLAVSPTSGDLTFVTASADYRRYFMPIRPFTIATRVMHIGRYGRDADDPRLLPLAWTLRDVVRGYGDTGPENSARYLTASRMVVSNVEVRFPAAALFGNWSVQSGLPLEGLVFADAGAFWTRPELVDTSWRALRSVGAGVRFNAAGFVFELDAVRPFDRPSAGWTVAFNFRPGF